ncbi:MAG: linear amide C-N hydrolase [Clostridia bacterium]|nr:linear amide C-N hydrolase [Clostridia bacterium]
MEKNKSKAKRWIMIGFLVLLAMILICLFVLFITFRNEIKSLKSLKKIDDYGMYTMTYYGDYGFDEFLKQGAENDSEIEDFIVKRLLKGLPIQINVTGGGCTAFAVKNENQEILFARNFDFVYAPSMHLYTKPANGYASVSTVNLSFAGYSKDHLPTEGLSIDSFLTLAAPYLPFDGMNEKGVAIALLAVPEAQIKNDDQKVTLNSTTMIRLVLDKAADVNEAIDLMKSYNIYFSGDIDCHYLIADSTGKSVLVEYYDNALQVVEADTSYQIASNFIAFNDLRIGEGYTEFERYDTVEETIRNHRNSLSAENAMDLLNEVGVYDTDGTDKLQWSVVYNLTEKTGRIWAHRNTDNLFEFTLDRHS